MDAVILSRIQFAFTLSFHILFPAITMGLAMFLVFWETLWLKTKQIEYYHLCRFWTKIFALAFGMGVVSGIVLSYEFGTNFSKFSETTGNILGPLLSYEVLTAFFLEAGFLGIMLFGWNRVPKLVHYLSTWLVFIGTLISAFWILSANSWMHTPTGYTIDENQIFHVKSWLEIIFNPSFPYRYFHMVFAGFLSSTFLVAGISAYYLRKKRFQSFAAKAFSMMMWFALILAPIQLVVGDLHGLNTLKHQPLKIAALEGRWETEKGAPLTLFAIPDPKQEKNNYAIEIPKLGSLILGHSFDAEIIGLKSVPPSERPYMPISFYSFRLMVGIGLLFIFIGLVGLYLRIRKKLYETNWFLTLCILASPLGFVAVIAGWFVTETGRQPWIVYGLVKTKDMVSPISAHDVLITLISFVVIYLVLLVSFIFYLLHEVKKGPSLTKDPNATHKTAHAKEAMTVWLYEDERDEDKK